MTTAYAAFRHGLSVIDADGPAITNEALTDRQPECVAVHPDRPDRVFCGTFDGGLHRSIDAGSSFARVGASTIDPEEDPAVADRRGAGDVSVMSLAINPDDPDEVWAGTEPSALFRSIDGGDSWTRIGGLTDQPSSEDWYFPPRPYTHHVRWIEVDPADPARLYVGIEAGALLVTPDRGETWLHRPTGSRRDNHTLATHPDAPGRVYSAAGDGYAESTDGGETWTHPQDGLEHRYVWGLAVDPGAPDRVFVAAASGARAAHGHSGIEGAESYVYRREGVRQWDRLDDRGLPMGTGVLRAVLAGGAEPGGLFALTNRGLFRTRNGGDAWTELDLDWSTAARSATGRGLAVVD